LGSAAQSIARYPKPAVGILTGCFIPSAEPPAAETDGPLGAVQLAVGLTRAGIWAGLLTDPFCENVIRIAANAAAGDDSPLPVGVIPIGRSDLAAVEWTETPDMTMTHLIAVERLGPAQDGHTYSMAGHDWTRFNEDATALYRRVRLIRIAIGDGGNELGMGSLDHRLVSAAIELGEQIHCTIPCDHLIVSGTSNWGAVGLLAALAAELPDQKASLLKDLSPQREVQILHAMVDDGRSVDGTVGEPRLSVDGIPGEIHAGLIAELLEVVNAT
jgi:hypothetical protein